MNLRTEVRSFIRDFKIMNLYQQFERLVLLIVSGLIVVIVVSALWSLMLQVVVVATKDNFFDPQLHTDFQLLFGAIFTVIIGLELKRSIMVAAQGHETVFQVRIVILVALLAILRKFIILDIEVVGALKVFALSGAAVGLGAVYWLIRDQDSKLKSAGLLDSAADSQTR